MLFSLLSCMWRSQIHVYHLKCASSSLNKQRWQWVSRFFSHYITVNKMRLVPSARWNTVLKINAEMSKPHKQNTSELLHGDMRKENVSGLGLAEPASVHFLHIFSVVLSVELKKGGIFEAQNNGQSRTTLYCVLFNGYSVTLLGFLFVIPLFTYFS